MTTEADIEKKFWKALKSDRTFMIGLADSENGLGQPMTAQIEAEERGPIYIFSSKDTDFVRDLGAGQDAVAHFAAKGHDVFANLTGRLTPDNDRATIDRLWNPFVAAWFEGGKDDPKLQLLRFDAHKAQVWLNENSLFAGIKLLLGSDPKKDYGDKTAQIHLS